MKLQIFTPIKHYALTDYSQQYNYPSVSENQQLYYGKYMTSNLYKIQKSTYSTVFKDNCQTYLMYLLGCHPTVKYQAEIHQKIYNHYLDVNDNTFKCQSFFNQNCEFELSSNFKMDLSVSSEVSFGKFTFPKKLKETFNKFLDKDTSNYYFNIKFKENIDNSEITLINNIQNYENYLNITYCDKNYFKFDVPSAQIQNPVYQQLSASFLDSAAAKIADLSAKLEQYISNK